MSAASPASQVRNTAARSAAPQRHTAGAPLFAFAAPSADDEIRLNLSDIPRLPASLDIEGLKPTLLSRLCDLIAPLNGR